MAWGAGVAPSQAPPPVITAPKDCFEFDIGEDHRLANHQQMKARWERPERESDRVRVGDIGRTGEGRPRLAAIVTARGNHRRLGEDRAIARRPALADGVDRAEAAHRTAVGKEVIWVDAGIHAHETLCPQVVVETVYQVLAAADETLRILDADVILFVPANPDGDDLDALCDPLVINGIDSLGAAMIQRSPVEGKPGVTFRPGARYSGWFNGGLRTTASFHNVIGLLSEIVGSPTPDEHPARRRQAAPQRGRPRADRAPAPALPAVGRLPGDGQPGGLRLRLTAPRAAPLQHLADGPQRGRARQPRQLDPSSRPISRTS